MARVALADASADWVTTLLALEARFVVRNAEGEREIFANDMFLGPYFTAMTDQDLLVRTMCRRRRARRAGATTR